MNRMIVDFMPSLIIFLPKFLLANLALGLCEMPTIYAPQCYNI